MIQTIQKNPNNPNFPNLAEEMKKRENQNIAHHISKHTSLWMSLSDWAICALGFRRSLDIIGHGQTNNSICTEYTFSFFITLSIQKKFWRNFLIAGFTVSCLATLSHKSTQLQPLELQYVTLTKGWARRFHFKCIVRSQGAFSSCPIFPFLKEGLASDFKFQWRRGYFIWVVILILFS